MTDRNYEIIDGMWRITGKVPGGVRRLAFWLYAKASATSEELFHKRTVVKSLHLLARRAGSTGLFSKRDVENESNIHGVFDTMQRESIFEVVEDYSVETKT